MLIPFLDYPVLFFNPLRRPPAKGKEELIALLKAIFLDPLSEIETDIDLKIHIRPRWRRFGAPKYQFGPESDDKIGGIFQNLFVTLAEFSGEVDDVPIMRRIATVAAMAEESGISAMSFHFRGADFSAHEVIAAQTLVANLDRIR